MPRWMTLPIRVSTRSPISSTRSTSKNYRPRPVKAVPLKWNLICPTYFSLHLLLLQPMPSSLLLLLLLRPNSIYRALRCRKPFKPNSLPPIPSLLRGPFLRLLTVSSAWQEPHSSTRYLLHSRSPHRLLSVLDPLSASNTCRCSLRRVREPPRSRSNGKVRNAASSCSTSALRRF